MGKLFRSNVAANLLQIGIIDHVCGFNGLLQQSVFGHQIDHQL